MIYKSLDEMTIDERKFVMEQIRKEIKDKK